MDAPDSTYPERSTRLYAATGPKAFLLRQATVEAITSEIRCCGAAGERVGPAAVRGRARERDRRVFKRRPSEYVDARWREFRARQACWRRTRGSSSASRSPATS